MVVSEISVSNISYAALNTRFIMSSTDSSTGGLKPTLGLVGITINAMALIAPGAFLWTTFQLQSPRASAMNMWASVAVATAIAL